VGRIIVIILVALSFVSVAEARGGRGSGRAPSRGGPRSGSRQNQRKEADQRQRVEERRRRVELARIEYAKRERAKTWDAESERRMRAALYRLLDATAG